MRLSSTPSPSAAATRSRETKPSPSRPNCSELRANSNFLTPRLGAFSADTWTGIALYIRNFLLNWFIFAPLFLGLLLIPHAAFDVLIWVNNAFGSLNWAVLAIAGLLLLAGLAMSVAGRPARDRPTARRAPGTADRAGRATVCPRRPAPGLSRGRVPRDFRRLAADHPGCDALGNCARPRQDGRELFYPMAYSMAFGAVLYAASPGSSAFSRAAAGSAKLRRILGTRRNPVRPLAEMICYTVSGAAAGAVGALGIALYQHLSGLAESPGAPVVLGFLFHGYSRIYMVIAAGVAWTMLAVLTADLLFTGLDQLSPVWRGRPGVVGACRRLSRRRRARLAELFGRRALWAARLCIDLGDGRRRCRAGHSVSRQQREDRGDSRVRRRSGCRSRPSSTSRRSFSFWPSRSCCQSSGAPVSTMPRRWRWAPRMTPVSRPAIAIGASIALVGASVVASYWINVNRFSLHAVYRNRLIRAFLGAARARHRETEQDPQQSRSVHRYRSSRQSAAEIDLAAGRE